VCVLYNLYPNTYVQRERALNSASNNSASVCVCVCVCVCAASLHTSGGWWLVYTDTQETPHPCPPLPPQVLQSIGLALLWGAAGSLLDLLLRSFTYLLRCYFTYGFAPLLTTSLCYLLLCFFTYCFASQSKITTHRKHPFVPSLTPSGIAINRTGSPLRCSRLASLLTISLGSQN